MRGIVVLMCVVVLVAGCGGTSKNSASRKGGAPEGAVATVGDTSIGEVELDLMAKGELRRLDMQAYQIKKQALEELITKELVKQAAGKAGMNVPEYTKKMVDDKIIPPSEKEIRAVYDARKGADAMPFDNVKDKIAEYLIGNQRRQLEGRLIAELKEESEVKVYLESPRIEIDMAEAPHRGSDSAPVTLVDFSDYECGFSKRARATIEEVLDAYGNKMLYVFKDYPLSFHRNAARAAEAAHCAGDQGKYFEYNHVLFKNQNSLSLEDLKEYAQELNLDMKKFNKCLTTSKYAKRVQDSLAEGSAAGVSGTPAFFINGIMLSGAQPFSSFKEIIDAELEKR
jgi:protein-disulfide isomerase